MKKFTRIFAVALLLVVTITNSACAYVKPFSECKVEFEAATADLDETAMIRDTCKSYIDAYNDGDSAAMTAARNILANAGLLQSDGNTDDLMEIKALYHDYSNAYMDKAFEYTPVMRNYFYWEEHLKLTNNAFSRIKDEHIPLVPFPWDCSYTSDAMGEFQDDFFDEGKDLSGCVGNIYLIEAVLWDAYPDEGLWLLRYTDKNGYVRRIAVGLPEIKGMSKEDLSEMPDVGESAYFFLIYLGTTDNGLRTFYLGISDTLVELMRGAYPEIMPGEE